MASGSDCNDQQRRVVPGTRDSIDEMQESILEEMVLRGYGEDDQFAVRISVEEALANAVLHGHRGDTTQPIDVQWTIDDDRVQVTVSDDGRGYDPEVIPDPTAEENLSLPSGRGLAMIRAFSDEVEVEPPGNRISFIRNRRGELT
jgi:serine/threonine-protein kinase RsbW